MSDALAPIITVPNAQLAHKVISASAGSGKTHALSGRYLSLLAAGENPSRILATTFTRAAAGEIRDRLLKRLAEATTQSKQRDDLAQSLGVKSIKPDHAMAMLARMARNLHTLQIRTLDSFFATIVRNFAIELGLPAECSVIDESDDRAMRHEAMRLMLDEREPQSLIELLRLLTRGDSDRGVMSTIDNAIQGLYELWRDTGDAAWKWIPPPAGLLDDANLMLAIDALANTSIPSDKRFASARLKNLESAVQRDWGEFLGGGLAKCTANGQDVYYKKPIDQELLDAYEPLVQHASAELVHRVREQTLATQALLRMFHEQYDRLKRQGRVLTFSDLTHAMIAGSVGQGDDGIGRLEEIGYRLDATIHHLLLDEFQDTSGAQWRALGGMALEIASQAPPDRSFFCVGDIKQSIYGWRGASPDILARLPSILPGVNDERLDVSWRSSPIVIETVNAVFESIADNPAMTDDLPHEEAATAWQGVYSRHDVAEKLRHAPGYVEMRTIVPGAEDKSPERKRKRLKAAAELAADLHRRDGNLSIAILTRTNASVARLLYELGPTGCNVPASGRGGGPLTDAPPVNVLLDLLHVADHPDDTIAAFNVAMSPLGVALGFANFADRFARWKLARQVRERLLLHGYQHTIAAWVKSIAASCDARELRRLTQLVELAGVHDAGTQAGLRTSPFIDVFESKDVPDSQPAPIEVMTVHQAKGLEFDAVILPDLSGRLRGAREPMVVFDRDDDSGMIKRICRYASEQTQSLLPGLAELVHDTRVRTVRESLAVLYVAVTRARHGVYAIIDPPSEKEKTWPRTHEGVLRGALSPNACEAGATVFETGDPKWIEKSAAARVKNRSMLATVEREPPRIAFANERPGVAVAGAGAAMSASSIRERVLARSKAESLREQLRLTNPEGRERGSVIHALFEQIEWLEEFAANDEALVSIARAVAPRRDHAWHRKQVAAFRAMLDKRALRDALSCGKFEYDRLIVHRELPYAQLVDGLVQTGSIDRLVLELDASKRFVRGTVIDFKTDAIIEGSHEAQAETHREQLQVYREAVAEMFNIDAKQIAMQVLLVGAGAAITLK